VVHRRPLLNLLNRGQRSGPDCLECGGIHLLFLETRKEVTEFHCCGKNMEESILVVLSMNARGLFQL
jgi:hypothetical protein